MPCWENGMVNPPYEYTFGMYEPDEGGIHSGRAGVHFLSQSRHQTEHGMVHQHFKLVSNYTIAENIIMGTETINAWAACCGGYQGS